MLKVLHVGLLSCFDFMNSCPWKHVRDGLWPSGCWGLRLADHESDVGGSRMLSLRMRTLWVSGNTSSEYVGWGHKRYK